MGLFAKEEEVRRKQNLKELEDKRLRFVELLAREGFKPDCCLYAMKDGGFAAVAKAGEEVFLLTGPAPGDEQDFTFQRAGSSPRVEVEEVLIKSQGLGGILGFGKKGGVGFRLRVLPQEGEPLEMEIVSGLGTYLEIRPGGKGKNTLLNARRRRGNANFVWDFRPVEREVIEPLRQRWVELLRGV